MSPSNLADDASASSSTLELMGDKLDIYGSNRGLDHGAFIVLPFARATYTIVRLPTTWE